MAIPGIPRVVATGWLRGAIGGTAAGGPVGSFRDASDTGPCFVASCGLCLLSHASMASISMSIGVP